MVKKDEEIEGMYTLVGDPDNPELEAADDSKISLSERIKRMKAKVFKDDFERSSEQREIAEQA